ncbi:tetratricopeptide repeat protein [Pedosphaera parvula]|uniref:TPR repeat-containing protein n=1 Tax=Pedosphaera parvula (strain Ellin514) TaxID=320771 RepID=B9XBT7_PEDPL|nr:tetratricopeptide repeat protein [Pedosphaera parvula]EEF62405.1 TPR repeat-containing protein [Pedosphaera parvula Ellin514]
MRVERWCCLLLALVTLAVYSPVIRNDFINYDDPDYVTLNYNVQGGLNATSIAWAFTTGHSTNWHPLTWLSHMLDCQFYGLNPIGHHLTNLLLHLCNTILLFLVMRLFTGELWPSALVAALFAWHPLHVESVAWVSERKDVLSTFFWLLTLLAYWWYARFPTIKRYLVVLACFLLGLLSKPMVVTLPFVLMLMDYWPLNRIAEFPPNLKLAGTRPITPVSWKQLVTEKTPLLLLSTASSVVTFLVQRAGGAVAPLENVTLTARVENALVSYLRYLGKMFFPHNLAVPYPMPEEWPAPLVIFAILALSFLTFLALKWLRRAPYFFMGYFFFLGTLVPVIGLIQVGRQSMADRYSYIPLIGIFIIIAWGIRELMERWPKYRLLAVGSICLLVGSCLPLTYLQARFWKSSIALFSHTLEASPDAQEARLLLGKAFCTAGQPEKAMEQFSQILRSNPNSADALFAIGVLRTAEHKLDEAVDYLTQAVRLSPEMPNFHSQLGEVLLARGNLGEAMAQFDQTLQLAPRDAIAHRQKGCTLARLGKLENAMAEFGEASQLAPQDAECFYDLALALALQKNHGAAIAQYRTAIRLKPDYAVALNDLAWLLATAPESELRNGNEAVPLAERARKLCGEKEPQYLGTLDAAYAEAGRFKEAITLAEKVRHMALASGSKDLVEAADKRLDAYRQGKPYHQP